VANGHGGARRGAGRPRKRTVVVTFAGGRRPLDAMLTIMNDDSLDVGLRLRAAACAAPYLHARLVEVPVHALRILSDERLDRTQGEWHEVWSDPDRH
jgi:hypothetical protein